MYVNREGQYSSELTESYFAHNLIGLPIQWTFPVLAMPGPPLTKLHPLFAVGINRSPKWTINFLKTIQRSDKIEGKGMATSISGQTCSHGCARTRMGFITLSVVYLLMCLMTKQTVGQVDEVTPPPNERRPVKANGKIYYLDTIGVPRICHDPIISTYSFGGVIRGRAALVRSDNPHVIKANLVVAPNSCLYIEPGCILQFAPGYGLIVNGTLIARGSDQVDGERIVFTKDPATSVPQVEWPEDARLVDGNRTLDGRLELSRAKKWRGVCTNYNNYTKADTDVACRHLGFVQGNFTYHSFAQNFSDYMLFESPGCKGHENSLFDCPGRSNIRTSKYICEGQQVIGFECEGLRPDLARDHWRGIEFYNSTFHRVRREKNDYDESYSILEYVDILYAGLDTYRDSKSGMRHPLASLSASPHPPILQNVTIKYGAFDAINMTDILGSVWIANSTISHNRGYGLYIQTAVGRVVVNESTVSYNWGDGIKMYMANYTFHNYERTFPPSEAFCFAPQLQFPVYPLVFHQDVLPSDGADMSQSCQRIVQTDRDRKLTLHVLLLEQDEQYAGKLEIFEGNVIGTPKAVIEIKNGSYTQSITTKGNIMGMRFSWSGPMERNCRIFKPCLRFLLQVTSQKEVDSEFQLVESFVNHNNGYGVNIQDMRSKVWFNTTEVSFNGYGAGIRIYQGAGEVIVNHTRVEENSRCGVNISYAGGFTLFNYTQVIRNHGYGVITEYMLVNKTRRELSQAMEVMKSRFELNEWIALRVGNYCRSAYVPDDQKFMYVSVNHSSFINNLDEAIEYLSCNISTQPMRNFSLAFNTFSGNERHGVIMSPLVNTLGIMINNTFENHMLGALRIDNGYDLLISRWYTGLPVRYKVWGNLFRSNTGRYAASIRLTQNSPLQELKFYFNRFVDNEIVQSFPLLNPRSRANAVVVISSTNVEFLRNDLEYNSLSTNALGTHLVDPIAKINARLNWWGFPESDLIYSRLFEQGTRYNLAKIEYYPALRYDRIYEDFPNTDWPQNAWKFERIVNTTHYLGGVLDRNFVTIENRQYYVDKDIFILPGYQLELFPGTRLMFASSVGMIIHGALISDGTDSNPVLLTLDDLNVLPMANRTATVRLQEGYDDYEGRLEVEINSEWGTVCDKGWTDRNAALVCQQLGLSYNPHYGRVRLFRVAMSAVPIWMSDVSCDEVDLDLARCRAVKQADHSCNHGNDVFLRCQPPSWAGVTLPAVVKNSMSRETQIRNTIIEKAGMFDAATMEFSPGLRIDYNFFVITKLTVRNCVSDGIHIKFNHPYSENRLEYCKSLNNLGNGIVTRSAYLNVSYSVLTHNGEAGFRFDPFFTEYDALSVRNFIHDTQVKTFTKMDYYRLGENSMVYLVSGVSKSPEDRTYIMEIEASGQHKTVTLEILDYNPLTNIEQVMIYDGDRSAIGMPGTRTWSIEKDLVDFPIKSLNKNKLTIKYTVNGIRSGRLAFVAHSRDLLHRLSVPTFIMNNCTLDQNRLGIVTKHYNNPSNEKHEIFFRHKEEVFLFNLVNIRHNREEAMHIPSVTKYHEHYVPSLADLTSPERIATIKYILSYCTLTYNGRAILAEHNHVDFANNVWQWDITHLTLMGSKEGGFEIELPRVNYRNEHKFHSVSVKESQFSDNERFAFTIAGHFATVNISMNNFIENTCRKGLMTVSGMEKELRIENNYFTNNIGLYVIDLDMSSHAEISSNVQGIVEYNNFAHNSPEGGVDDVTSTNTPTTYTLALRGVLQVRANLNLMQDSMQYALVAAITALSLDNEVDVTKNWWGTGREIDIRRKIFDFDDWNNFAIARYSPYLSSDILKPEPALVEGNPNEIFLDPDHLGGRVMTNLALANRERPFLVVSDLTIMPDATLTIGPGAHLQFMPNIGILVLGKLIARGLPYSRIVFSPAPSSTRIKRRERRSSSHDSCEGLEPVRLHAGLEPDEGFLQICNASTNFYSLMCDEQFNERTAEVICRQLGYETVNVEVRFTHLFDFYKFKKPSHFIKEFWANTFYCKGNENNLDQCALRLNYNIDRCIHNANYTFIRCGKRNLEEGYDYWGNIRFAHSTYEENALDLQEYDESFIDHVDIHGAGFLHGEKVGAIQTTYLTPAISRVNITSCAFNGIDIIAPRDHVNVSNLNITRNLGHALNILVLHGETSETALSSFNPLSASSIPYHLYGIVEICRMEKEIELSERMLLYFKYSYDAVDCIKIIKSKQLHQGQVALRFLQLNLYNDTFTRNSIEIFDGSEFSDDNLLIELTPESSNEAVRKNYVSSSGKGRTLMIHLHASSGHSVFGFIAEVVKTPQSGQTYSDDKFHTVTNNIFRYNQDGALQYQSVGESTPSLYMERCWIGDNGLAILNLTASPVISINTQGTRQMRFANNFVAYNKGGMHVHVWTESQATKIYANITNNVFAFNTNGETLNITGHHYQRILVYQNEFFNNTASDYRHLINVENVYSNFTANVISKNVGHHILATYQAKEVHIEQIFYRNSFINNNCSQSQEFRATVLMGRGSPRFDNNYLVNELNDFEIMTGEKPSINGRFVSERSTQVNAQNNWWGSREPEFIGGKVLDEADNPWLMRVDYSRPQTDNNTFTDGGCQPGWIKNEGSCYRYYGAALPYYEASNYCAEQGAYLARTTDQERFIRYLVQSLQMDYKSDMKIWVYGDVRPGRCSSFRDIYVVEEEDCTRIMLPFLCSRDVIFSPSQDGINLALAIALGVLGAILLIIFIIVLLCCIKSRQRTKEHFERRESIRSSVRSRGTLSKFSSEDGLSTKRRPIRSVDDYFDPNQGGHKIDGVRMADASTGPIITPGGTGQRRLVPLAGYSRRAHYDNDAYKDSTPEENESLSDNADKQDFSDNDDGDDGNDEGVESQEEGSESDHSDKTVETSASVRKSREELRDNEQNQNYENYRYRHPRVENEIDSLRASPAVLQRLYSNLSNEDKSIDMGSERSRSVSSMNTSRPGLSRPLYARRHGSQENILHSPAPRSNMSHAQSSPMIDFDTTSIGRNSPRQRTFGRASPAMVPAKSLPLLDEEPRSGGRNSPRTGKGFRTFGRTSPVPSQTRQPPPIPSNLPRSNLPIIPADKPYVYDIPRHGTAPVQPLADPSYSPKMPPPYSRYPTDSQYDPPAPPQNRYSYTAPHHDQYSPSYDAQIPATTSPSSFYTPPVQDPASPTMIAPMPIASSPTLTAPMPVMRTYRPSRSSDSPRRSEVPSVIVYDYRRDSAASPSPSDHSSQYAPAPPPKPVGLSAMGPQNNLPPTEYQPRDPSSSYGRHQPQPMEYSPRESPVDYQFEPAPGFRPRGYQPSSPLQLQPESHHLETEI